MLSATLFSADVDSLISTITTTRDGATDAQIKSAPNPFLKTQGEIYSEPILNISAIFGDSVLVNNHWLKLGMVEQGCKLIKIEPQNATFMCGKKQKIANLKKQTF